MTKGIKDAENEAIENKKIDKGITFSKEQCKDIEVGKDGEFWFERTLRNKKKEKLTVCSEYEGVTIIIVLESPHKDEFKNTNPSETFFTDTFMSNPALGKTGDKLQTFFTDDNLKRLLGGYYPIDGKYRVILMNSIQYQCSLGLKTNRIRDYIWLKMWFEYNYEKDFCKRLKSYNPDVIINLCTLGDHSKEKNLEKNFRRVINKEYLKKCGIAESDIPEYLNGGQITLRKIVSCSIKNVIRETMRKNYREILFFEGNHPSSWYSNFDSIKRPDRE